ncbi:pentapeptide repeat-containing protein, partial [Pantanalinema rosaneae CENA516]|uniref:pentapeptide repeat-containing protein n=1 Tax=Pantanalinema rosaneae TaxID=1620701 RepID=UPI003D6DBE30
MSATAATSTTVGTTLAIARRQVTVLDHQKVVKARIVLEGDINSVDANFKSTLEVLLKCYGGDTIEITDIQAGSIRITIQGSQQDIERLRERIASGELTQINDCPIEDLVILGDESLEVPENPALLNGGRILRLAGRVFRAFSHRFIPWISKVENPSLQTKWELIQAIKAQPQSYRQLSGADLSDADLSDADLSDADLSDADL